MALWANFLLCYPAIVFFLSCCDGFMVTGERCRYWNGVFTCEPEIISSTEKRKLLDTYGNKGCNFETYTNELQIEDYLCPSVSENIQDQSNGVPLNMGITTKTMGLDGDDIFSGIPEWNEEDILPDRQLEEMEMVEEEPMEFHPRCSKNVVISSDLRTAHRKVSPSTGFGTAMTKKPLKPGQIFDVWVNYAKIPDMPWIGVTHYSPEIIIYPEQMLQLPEGTWIWDTYTNEILRNGETIVKPFLPYKLDINNGDRFGVSITDSGTVHFHHNGRDLGPADVGLKEEMWGFVDMYFVGTNATIAN